MLISSNKIEKLLDIIIATERSHYILSNLKTKLETMLTVDSVSRIAAQSVLQIIEQLSIQYDSLIHGKDNSNH